MDKYLYQLFSIETENPFVIFSTPHFVTLAVLVAVLILWFFLLKRFPEGRGVKALRVPMAALLLGCEVIYVVWSIAIGDWSMAYSLPIQLCEATAFLAAYMLLRNSYAAFEVVYFLGLGGSLQALATPDLYYPFPHIRYLIFFLEHGAVILSIFYMMLVHHFLPTLKSLLKAIVAANIYLLVMIGVNALTGGNYLFLSSKPPNGSILDFLGPWPWYLLSMEGIGAVIFLLLYLPVWLAKRRNINHEG